MRSIVYKYSRKLFLTSELTKRIESRVAILYPSTRYSIINRTAEYLIRIYIMAGLMAAGLFIFADFSIYYAMLCSLMVYAVVNSKIYGDLDKLEIKLLLQLEKFVSDVKFRFQFDGMLEEAIQDAVNYADYEMSIQGEKILECLRNCYVKEKEEYSEISPNNFFLTFYSICLMTLKYGDKKIDGQSMFVKNLGYLKEDINIEQLKRRKINNQFMGLVGLTLLPVFAIKPIEKWALYNMPEMQAAYYGIQGMITTIFLMVFTIAVYKLITVLKRINYTEKYKNRFIEQLAENETINRFIIFYISHRKKQAEKINKLLREVVYSYNLAEFILIRWLYALCYTGGGFVLTVSIGITGTALICTVMVCCVAGYYTIFISILIRKQILIMEREEEIVRFQTIILMIMHIDRITIAEILQRLESFAVLFKTHIYELSNVLSYKGIDTFREAKGTTGFTPYEKMMDSFIACDTMPVYQAFEDVESDRMYYVDKHKQDNDEIINKKSLIARAIAFLPLCLVIIVKLILPFVVQGISSLGVNMTL
ncbi:MAG: hypothetical protein K2N61_11560 [Lachnospiraceae bacterium]|nr:hypothetical protein [Lachnospiraceae bacterium]